MKNLRRNFERFCARNRNKGIQNLMLYYAIGNIIVYVMSLIDPSNTLYFFLYFDPSLILHGQVWRLFTYIFTDLTGGTPFGLFLDLFALYCYYWVGRSLEAVWGTFRFNLFYLSGILITDIAALALGCYASVFSLNLSLFLAYATLYPDAQFLIMFIIPIRARWLALVYLFLEVVFVISTAFPSNLFPVFALLNYFLFLGADVLNLLPDSLRMKLRRKKSPKTIHFPRGGQRTSSGVKSTPAYTHKCTVCGRTDVSDPGLEFRYCSKCNGYYCYCIDHINNHTHIE